MANPNPSGPKTPIVSEFAADPDMAELVGLFVTELPDRVASIQRAVAAGQTETLTRLAHQLRGASAGYGFPTIGQSAERLELRLKQLSSASGPAPGCVEAVTAQVNELVDLCNRVRAAA